MKVEKKVEKLNACLKWFSTPEEKREATFVGFSVRVIKYNHLLET